MAVDEFSVDELTVDEFSVDELTVDGFSVDEFLSKSFDELPWLEDGNGLKEGLFVPFLSRDSENLSMVR